mmetsp:Transcript_29792/g.74482  ORF Transcript_29792/g.74482 Transcript_29792/m.74482 type:complete len:110 (-) Transcript_29792:328-657(-)
MSGIMDLMQKLFLSCGPSAPMPEETGHEKIEALPPMAEVVTASARKLFFSMGRSRRARPGREALRQLGAAIMGHGVMRHAEQCFGGTCTPPRGVIVGATAFMLSCSFVT